MTKLDAPMKAAARQYEATSKFHARMARAYAAAGDTKNAKAAKRAEAAAKKSAQS